jgi:hypothetical protein
MKIISYTQVKSKIIRLRNCNVILDSDVAGLYGVETKRVNEAIKRNSEKFPDGYLMNLTSNEWLQLKSQNATSIDEGKKIKPSHSRLIDLKAGEWKELKSTSKSQIATSIGKGGKVKLPTAFTERGLYMLATILKSPQAVATTIAIIDAFAELKNLAESVQRFSATKNNLQKVEILESGSAIVADLLGNELLFNQDEVSFKIKLPFFEMTRKITKIKK